MLTIKNYNKDVETAQIKNNVAVLLVPSLNFKYLQWIIEVTYVVKLLSSTLCRHYQMKDDFQVNPVNPVYFYNSASPY